MREGFELPRVHGVLQAVARHAAQAGIAVVSGGVGERVGDVRPAGDDLAEGVDRAGSDIGIVMMQQLQRSRHEQFLARPALGLLAAVTRQGVQRTLQDSGVLVIQGGDEVDERAFVGEVIEKRRTKAANHRVRVVHAAPHRRQSRLACFPQVDLGPSAPFRVGELRDPSVEVQGGRKPVHRRPTLGTHPAPSRTRLRQRLAITLRHAGGLLARGGRPTSTAATSGHGRLSMARGLPPRDVWADERVIVGRSHLDGRGLLASEDIAAACVVLRLGGRLVSTAQLVRLIAEADRDPDAPYVDTITIYEDAHLVLPSGTVAHFGNHSCDPNLWHVDAYQIATRRDVRVGEELTLDYGTSSGARGFAVECRCGSALCRGRVTSEDWRLPDLQARYAGHWTPALQQRIDRA